MTDTPNRTIRQYIHVQLICICCGDSQHLPINMIAFCKWRTGLMSLEDSFPMLTEDEITFLTTGYCKNCSDGNKDM